MQNENTTASAPAQALSERMGAIPTVADLLKNYGWSVEEGVSHNTIAAALEATAHVEIVEQKVEAKKLTLRERRLDLGTMMTTPPPPIDMVLRGLPLGACGVIIGAGGVGKSMEILHIAAVVATGHDDLGCLLDDGEHHTGRVVYLAGEDDDTIIHHRVRAFAEHLAEERRENVIAAIGENVDIVPLVGTAPVLLNAKGEANETALAEIREAASGTRLLVIDPLRQFHAAEEVDNGAMTTLSKAFARIAHEEKCSIIVVHHVNKASVKDDYDDAHAASGASAITDNARWVMLVRKLSEKQHEALDLDGEHWEYLRQKLVKANYAALGPEHILRRGEGGVLSQIMVRERDIVTETITKITGGPVQRPHHEIYDEGDDALDPTTGEPFPLKTWTRGYEDADLFGAV
ncbi:MAG: AAA family ATPase [Vulcanimicrobiaceae bacterium]